MINLFQSRSLLEVPNFYPLDLTLNSSKRENVMNAFDHHFTTLSLLSEWNYVSVIKNSSHFRFDPTLSNTAVHSNKAKDFKYIEN